MPGTPAPILTSVVLPDPEIGLLREAVEQPGAAGSDEIRPGCSHWCRARHSRMSGQRRRPVCRDDRHAAPSPLLLVQLLQVVSPPLGERAVRIEPVRMSCVFGVSPRPLTSRLSR